jgi:hypothetical protein
MDSWIPFFCGTIIGSLVTAIAFVVIIAKGDKKNIVDVDPEIEEAERQWKEQSRGY